MSLLNQTTSALRRWLTQPASELSRTQRTLRWTFDLFRHCARELYYDRATEMAAALTYRTIFSLIPVLVMALLVFNALGGFRSFGDEVQTKLYEYLGIAQIAVPQQSKPQGNEHIVITDDDVSAAELAAEQKLRVDQFINQLTDKVSQISITSIGTVGMIVLIWAALALVITVEDTFNRIYDCPVGRSWRLRIPVYWAVLTLGPVLFGGSLWLSSFILGLAAKLGMGWFVGQVTQLGALALSWILLYLLYTLMPNTYVARRPAMIGALVAAILYEQGKALFGLYLKNSVFNYQLYGTLALLPIFLFWIYLTWLIVLFGLELTYTLQAMKHKRFKHRDELIGSAIEANPAWLIPIMVSVGQSFSKGQSTSVDQVSGELNLPVHSVKALLRELAKEGLVHQVTDPRQRRDHDDDYMLSLPPDGIEMNRLLELGHRLTVASGSQQPKTAWQCLEKLDQAQRQALQGSTLAALLK